MLLYALILMALGGGIAGWMGYRSQSESRSLKARMASRNNWLKKHSLAKQTADEHVSPDVQSDESDAQP